MDFKKKSPFSLPQGLPEAYEPTVFFISNKFDTLTLDEVETLLLAHETR